MGPSSCLSGRCANHSGGTSLRSFVGARIPRHARVPPLGSPAPSAAVDTAPGSGQSAFTSPPGSQPPSAVARMPWRRPLRGDGLMTSQRGHCQAGVARQGQGRLGRQVGLDAGGAGGHGLGGGGVLGQPGLLLAAGCEGARRVLVRGPAAGMPCRARTAPSAQHRARPALASSGQLGPARASSGQLGPARASSGQPLPARASSGQLGPARASSGQPLPARASSGPSAPGNDLGQRAELLGDGAGDGGERRPLEGPGRAHPQAQPAAVLERALLLAALQHPVLDLVQAEQARLQHGQLEGAPAVVRGRSAPLRSERGAGAGRRLDVGGSSSMRPAAWRVGTCWARWWSWPGRGCGSPAT
jgi:hypothetical protein